MNRDNNVYKENKGSKEGNRGERSAGKEKKRPKIYKMLSCRIIALALALWFFGMALLTWAVAEDMRDQVNSESLEYAASLSSRRGHEDTPIDFPGAMEADMIRAMNEPYRVIYPRPLLPIVLDQTPSKMSSDDWYWGKWDLLYGFEVAILYSDNTGESVFTSGNYLTFAYTGAEHWNTGSAEARGLSYIATNEAGNNLDVLDGLVKDGLPSIDYGTSYEPGFYSLLSPTLLRLEGYFEGNEFHPITVDRGQYVDINLGGEVRDVDQLCTLDAQNKVVWTSLLTLETIPDQPTETIYAWNLNGVRCDYDPVTVNGITYDSLAELLETDFHDIRAGLYESDRNHTKESLWESVSIRMDYDTDSYGDYYYMLAIRFWPMQYALLRLIPTYLVSLALVAIAVWLVLSRVKKYLDHPLHYLAYAAEKGAHVYPSASLDEVYRLETYVADTHRKQAETQNELQQLRTALDYAKNAEENRRQLISNITHELKTPLAVIHSYAEGLQAGIAAEKQDEYLSVILDEAEHMDSMVLQMLDLSRLEAGKVRLAVDQFSLLQLTRSVAEKLAPMMEAKELSFNYGLAEDFQITADEGRIRQVITNLLSNALKYTAPGGRILVNVYPENRSARFTMINTADHLSDEALLKVWDSFYRVDASRTEPGTGLGLTLVKNIVELHRGTCYVRNTTDKTAVPVQTAVEFGFYLPMRL